MNRLSRSLAVLCFCALMSLPAASRGEGCYPNVFADTLTIKDVISVHNSGKKATCSYRELDVSIWVIESAMAQVSSDSIESGEYLALMTMFDNARGKLLDDVSMIHATSIDANPTPLPFSDRLKFRCSGPLFLDVDKLTSELRMLSEERENNYFTKLAPEDLALVDALLALPASLDVSYSRGDVTKLVTKIESRFSHLGVPASEVDGLLEFASTGALHAVRAVIEPELACEN